MPGHCAGHRRLCGQDVNGCTGQSQFRRRPPYASCIDRCRAVHFMTRSRHRIRIAALAALSLLLLAGAAAAQEQRSSGGFLDNLFSRGEQQGQQRQGDQNQTVQPQVAQSDPGDLSVRLDRVENALRQLTGTLEQLQYRNQQLEMQLKRMQDDTEYRFQQLGSRGGLPAAAQPRAQPPQPPVSAPAGAPGARSDVFNPALYPNAAGAPRVLGNETAAAPIQNADAGPPVGAPGGRAPGAPLDLSTLAANPPPAQPNLPGANAAAMTPAQL